MNNTKKALVAIIGLMMLTAPQRLWSQQYIATQGMIHVPTADMDSVPSARAGIHYMPKEMVPDMLTFENEKYNTGIYYLSVTPFRWIEIGLSRMLMKSHKAPSSLENPPIGFYGTDRQLTIRLQPLRENQWWPSVVLGGNDIWGTRSGSSDSFYFRNYYLSVSKHIEYENWKLGAHLSYRKYKDETNSKWNGIVGGLTLQPGFYKPLRAICEYDGNGVNIGADCLLLRHILIQVALLDCKHVTAGACLYMTL